MPAPKHDLGPDEIRALRGDSSRADFARKIGVTPLTVYRWELPDGAPEARRPRGTVAERLRRVAAPFVAPAMASSDTLDPDDAAIVLPIMDHLLRAELSRVDDDLMHAMMGGHLRSNAGRAMAQAILAIDQVLARNEFRIGFTTLQPALAAADEGLLPASVEIVVRIAASFLLSSADGRLFDAGRANTQVARGERLCGRDTTPDLLFFLRYGGALVSLYTGAARGAVNAAHEALVEVIDRVQEPLTKLLAAEYRAHHSMVTGHTAQTVRRFEEVAAQARELGVPSIEARSLAFRALRMTSEAFAPEKILETALEAQRVAVRARLAPGFHGLFGAKSAGEAHLRLGHFDDAERELNAGIEVSRAMTFVPIPFVMPYVRLYETTGRTERIADLAEHLSRIPRPIAHATRALLAAWTSGGVGLHEAEQALEATDPNPYMLLDMLVHGVSVRLASNDTRATRLAVRRAQRLLDRYPSLMLAGLLKRHVALLACREGRLDEAIALLEASIATFALGGDRIEMLRGRWVLARVHAELAQEGAAAEVAAAEAELAEARVIPLPYPLVFGDVDASAPPSVLRIGAAPRAEGMSVPVERLSVRGLTPWMLREELVAVVSEMVPGRGVVLQEITAAGEGRVVAERGDASAAPEQWFELGDGLGARLRFGVGGALPDGAHEPLRLVATVAGLALEVASLRGVAEEPATDADVAVPDIPGFIASSASMQRLRREIAQLGSSRATVILQGESGTGKEVVARAIHDLSARAKGPYIAFNCAAVPRDLFEGQLFGYRRGSFTGALVDHPGVIRAAHGGTLFLDEIGELPLELQAKLLRFLENREVLPLGESRPIEVDVRTIAATHRDLGERVREGTFREDLFYRLQVVPLAIPPLRERPEDIVALARHFVRTLTPAGAEPPTIAPDALVRLTSHTWPGNVRELRNAIERALAFAPLPRMLGAAHLRVGEGTLRPSRG